MACGRHNPPTFTTSTNILKIVLTMGSRLDNHVLQLTMKRASDRVYADRSISRYATIQRSLRRFDLTLLDICLGRRRGLCLRNHGGAVADVGADGVGDTQMVASKSTILRAGERLSHSEADRLAQTATDSGAQIVILEMSQVLEATTPAFARLVLLRRELLQQGRDLRLVALRGQPARLLEIHRLGGVLPRINELPAEHRSSQSLPVPPSATRYQLLSA
jgi:hypothetical protein